VNLFVRLIRVYLRTLGRRSSLTLFDSSSISLRVYPNDLDIYGHVNNGRYLTLMDLGRFDLILRSKLREMIGRQKWNPLVATVSIRYKKSLKVFQAFTLNTKIVAWDERWFFLEQTFVRDHQVYAHAWVRGLFYGSQGRVPTKFILKALGESRPSPPVPDSLKAWPPEHPF
jgi:YbgC/YbaW family acyl-CoA thioester hydrolase